MLQAILSWVYPTLANSSLLALSHLPAFYGSATLFYRARRYKWLLPARFSISLPMLPHVVSVLICCLVGSLSLLAAPVKPFLFNGQAIAPGHKLSVLLPVRDGHDSTVIPVTVFHGRRPGPVLGIIAGVHGYEYPPIIAAQQFAQTLDPAQLSGTVLLVHLANVPSFLGRRIQVNPQDIKNLN
jgi:hypothetical protein